MTDDLDTLRREIAEALGYAVKPSGDLWALVCPDGKRKPNFGAEWAAWSATPDWPRDANAALALPMGSVELVITIYTEARRGFVVLHAENNEFCVKAENVNEIAEAVARAWLAWRRAGEG